MSLVRTGSCACCGAPLVWVRSFGFGEPRPLEADPEGPLMIDRAEARYRVILPSDLVPPGRRYRAHWPCQAAATPDEGPAAGGGRGVLGGEPRVQGPVRVAVVPHAHWDREWYLPFQRLRLRAVTMVDGLLDLLEVDLSVRTFLLDGQTALVDDYLALRPGAEPRLRRLALEGRLSFGPFEVQADELLLAGETLVRNLQRGLARAAALGRVLPVGYLADEFGHASQLPQLLRQVGIEHAVVFRGVPAAVRATAFEWRAPDGSAVRAEFLGHGYSNAVRLGDDAKELIDRTRDLDASLGEARIDALLLMNGSDFTPPFPPVGRLVAEANALQDDYHFFVADLGEHLRRERRDGLPVVVGELRGMASTTITRGVVSNRVDVRLAIAAAERALIRHAEPLCALVPGPGRDGALEEAWRLLLADAPHDSACGTVPDEVAVQVLARAGEARDIGEGLVEERVGALARTVDADEGEVLVVEPVATPRRSLATVTVDGRGPFHLVEDDGRIVPTQATGALDRVEVALAAPPAPANLLVDLIGHDHIAGYPVAAGRVVAVEDGTGFHVSVIAASGSASPPPDASTPADSRWLDELRGTLAARLAAGHPATVRVVHPTRSAIAQVAFDGAGWKALRLAEGAAPTAIPHQARVRADGRGLGNGLVEVEVDADGALAIRTADGLEARGLFRLVDDGDAGDLYNWSPPASDVTRTAVLDDVSVVERGPIRATLLVRGTLTIPSALDAGTVPARRGGATPVVLAVALRVEVVAGERAVRVETTVENQARDHRIRALLPLPAPATGSSADAAFAVVDRPLAAEGNPMEAPLSTHPSLRFVDCSGADGGGTVGLGVVHDGALEHELLDGGCTLALTVLRSTGTLSRADGSVRPQHAGPPIPTPDAQVQGQRRRRFAVVLHHGGWEDADLDAVADAVLVPVETAVVAGSDRTQRRSATRLAVDGASVTAVTRTPGLTVRVVRLSPTNGCARMTVDGAPARGWTVDLLGRRLGRVDDGRVELGAWQIATVVVDER